MTPFEILPWSTYVDKDFQVLKARVSDEYIDLNPDAGQTSEGIPGLQGPRAPYQLDKIYPGDLMVQYETHEALIHVPRAQVEAYMGDLRPYPGPQVHKLLKELAPLPFESFLRMQFRSLAFNIVYARALDIDSLRSLEKLVEAYSHVR